MPPKPKPERDFRFGLGFTDSHFPYQDDKVLRAIEHYIEDECLDWWFHLGDLIDNEAISDFVRDKPRQMLSAAPLKAQAGEVNKWLDQHLAIVEANNPEVRKVLVEGNHEYRTERYIDRHPHLKGMVEVEEQLHLKKRGIEYVRFWSRGDVYRIGKLCLGHGVYTVQNHAAKHVREYGCNLLYGHLHDVQAHYIRRRGSNHPLMAQSIGCTCRYDMLYMRGRPMNWMTAFVVVGVFPDGTFQHQVVPVINGRFIGPTNGKVYRA